jgi:hypothetical protein
MGRLHPAPDPRLFHLGPLMAFLFGGGKSVKPQYTGLQTQTSSSDQAVAIYMGANRGAPNMFWQGDFKAHKHQQGKGFGGSATSYTYTASIQLGLCEGPITGIGTCWQDQGTAVSFSSLGFSLFTGTDPQSPWSYLVTAHPTQALSYNGVSYLAAANYNLGSSASLPNHSFEIKGPHYGTAPNGIDADPALCLTEFLTNAQYGCGFPYAELDQASIFSSGLAPTTGDGAWQTYCQAMGFGLSPAQSSQEAMRDILLRWAMLTNSAVFWPGYSLKMVPYGDASLTANGVTYLPPTGVVYNLSPDDFCPKNGGPPLLVQRRDPADSKNIYKLNINNRANAYNKLPLSWQADVLVDLYGPLDNGATDAPEVCDAGIGNVMLALIGQRGAFVDVTYSFTLGPEFIRLEPMDVVTLSEPEMLMDHVPARIIAMKEEDSGDLTFEAEPFLGEVGTGHDYTRQGVSNTPLNTLIDPGSVNPPIIVEPSSLLVGATPQVQIAVSGGDGTNANPNWGGCEVWISLDDVNYTRISGGANQPPDISAPAPQGKLSAGLASYGGANPDTGHTLSVDMSLSDQALSSGSALDASQAVTLCYADGEWLSYETATLTGANAYNLTTLYRGLYGSAAASHASGTAFSRWDNAIFKYDLPASYIGQILYLKFPSFNLYGGALQDLSACTAYSYTPTGAGFGGGSGGVPTAPTISSAAYGPDYVIVTLAANPVTDNVTTYRLYRAPGTGASFGSAVLIATISALTYTDTGRTPSTGYTYFAEAVNVVGASSPSAGFNATTTASSGANPFGFAFDRDIAAIVPSSVVRYFDTPVPWTITAAATSETDVHIEGGTGPSAQTDFDLQVNGVSVGTLRFAASATAANFIKASASNLSAHDITSIVAPSDLNGMSGRLVGVIAGTR